METLYNTEASLLSKAVLTKDLRHAVIILFGNDPLFPDYYRACLDKNFEKAEKLVKEGAFAEHTYLWYARCRQDCCLSGCSDQYLSTAVSWLLYGGTGAKKFMYDLLGLGLLNIEDCPKVNEN